MEENKTIKEATELELKASLFDIGVQIENLYQQKQALLNELISRKDGKQQGINPTKHE